MLSARFEPDRPKAPQLTSFWVALKRAKKWAAKTSNWADAAFIRGRDVPPIGVFCEGAFAGTPENHLDV